MTRLTDEQIKKFQEVFTVEDLKSFLQALKWAGALDSEEVEAIKLDKFLKEIQ